MGDRSGGMCDYVPLECQHHTFRVIYVSAKNTKGGILRTVVAKTGRSKCDVCNLVKLPIKVTLTY